MPGLILHEGAVLRNLAFYSNLSTDQICEALGISRQHLARMYKKEKLPKKVRESAAHFFNVEPEEFDQLSLRQQIESLKKDVDVLRAENAFLKAKSTENEARIKALEAENAYLKAKYN